MTRFTPAALAAFATLGTVAMTLEFSCTRSRALLAVCHSVPDMEPIACELKKGDLVVTPQGLTKLSFDSDAPAAILVNDHDFYFVIRTGKTAPALKFDNGADYFVEGLARTVKNGKVGFVNPQLDIVIAPVWDFALPFDHGTAKVCMGCKQTPVGEHSTAAGGTWFTIDRRGTALR